jgi:hypothetical protein
MFLFAAPILAQTTSPETYGAEAFLQSLSVTAVVAASITLLWTVVCGARLFAAGAHLRRCRKADEDFLKAHQDASHSLEVYQDALTFEGSPRFSVYSVAAREMAFHLMGTDVVDKGFSTRLRASGRITPTQMESVRCVQARTAEFAGRELGSGLGGGAIGALPFVGLLGALLSLLIDLASGTTGPRMTVSALFPMVTSVAGYTILLLWHNHLVQRLGEAAGEVGDFAVELATQFDRAFVDHRKPMESLPSLGSMIPGNGPNFSQPPSDTSRSFPVIIR